MDIFVGMRLTGSQHWDDNDDHRADNVCEKY